MNKALFVKIEIEDLVPYKIFNTISAQRKENVERANKAFSLAKYFYEKNIIDDIGFKVFCLRHGFNKKRLVASFSEISVILGVDVELALAQYAYIINLIKKNKNLLVLENENKI